MPNNEVVPIPEREQATVAATVRSLVEPGATLDGECRRQLAVLARKALDSAVDHSQKADPDATSVDTSPLDKLTTQLAARAHTVRFHDVAHTIESGVDSATYVEVLSLVARLAAIDTMHFGLGHEPAPLPEAVPGPPTGSVDERATLNQGWIPTIGAASPPNALSLLPDEDRAMHQLHGVLYLTMAEMADSDISRGLHRTQMELVAARTSLLNKCFF